MIQPYEREFRETWPHLWAALSQLGLEDEHLEYSCTEAFIQGVMMSHGRKPIQRGELNEDLLTAMDSIFRGYY